MDRETSLVINAFELYKCETLDNALSTQTWCKTCMLVFGTLGLYTLAKINVLVIKITDLILIIATA